MISRLGLGRPDWRIEGRDWPHREHSQFLQRDGIRWHVQVMGSGPPLLLLHGTGASTHSFRDLMPLLSQRFTVVAPDLPGHAFSATPPPFQPSLPSMAAALRDLLTALDMRPEVAVGHSAGAALLAQMTLDRPVEFAPRLVVGLGAAMVPFRGVGTSLFAPAARMLSQSGLAAQIIAFRAQDHASMDRLIRSTGSSLDRRGVELYQRLAGNAGHVASVLAMLACWDLDPLYRRLTALDGRFLFLAGEGDRAVPLSQQREVAALVRGAELRVIHGAGHLLHEERPGIIAQTIFEEADRAARGSGGG